MENKNLWGGRFKQGLDEEVWGFCRGNLEDVFLYRGDLVCSLSHCRALKSAGVLTEREFNQLSSAIERLWEENIYSYDEEDIHSYIQSKLKKLAPGAYKKLHTARSRNDLVAGASIFWIRVEISQLILSVTSLQKALVEQAKASTRLFIPSFTHLQDAQIISVAHYLLSWVEALETVKKDFLSVFALGFSPLGACAGAGSNIPVDINLLAEAIDAEPYKNSLFAVSDRSYYLRALFAAAHLGLVLSRLAEDWIIYSSREFGFIILPDSHATGSSIMPHKKNPDVLELVRARSAVVMSKLNEMFMLLKGIPSAYNRDMQEDKAVLVEAAEKIDDCLSVLISLCKGMQWNKDALDKALSNDFLYATDIMEELILKGMASRDAHSAVGALVLACEESGKKLSELSFEEREKVLRDFNFKDEQWLKFFSPERSVNAKKTANSTSLESVENQLSFWSGVIDEFFSHVDDRIED